MYARVVRVQFKEGMLDEAIRIVDEAVVPVLKEQKGFKSQFLLTQQETRNAISINLWETEADLTAFETSSLYGKVLGNLATVLDAPPASDAYEVSVKA